MEKSFGKQTTHSDPEGKEQRRNPLTPFFSQPHSFPRAQGAIEAMQMGQTPREQSGGRVTDRRQQTISSTGEKKR